MAEPSAGPNPHTFPCNSCGADLTFAPGTENLTCEYCGSAQKIGQPAAAEGGGAEAAPAGQPAPKAIVEHDFRNALAQATLQPAAALVQNGQEVNCKDCGATTVLEGQAGSCPYCDSPVVAALASDEKMIAPESVLPFKVPEKKAREEFYKWVGGLWFAPGDLTSRARSDRIDGVYLPYWTYDARTNTDYDGQRGEHYWDDETYTDSQGQRQTRRVQRTRWHPASGHVRVNFDDVLVCANKALPRDVIENLEPWDLVDLKPYDPAYLSGFVAERYAIDLEEGFVLAKQRMAPTIHTSCCDDIGGDEQRVTSSNTAYGAVTFKHVLLPLWISSFRYDNKVYRFMINARTGEVAGERPWSCFKIALAIMAAMMLFGCLFFCMAAAGGQ